MKRIKPSKRESQRYLKFKVHTRDEVGFEEILRKMKEASRNYMGLKEVSKACPWMIKNLFDEKEGEGVIRVQKGFEEDMRASLLLVEDFSGQKGFFEITRVSGTLDYLT